MPRGVLVFEVTLLAFATAAGFVAAGLAASLYTWVSDRPAAFPRPSLMLLPLVAALLAAALIGPVVVMRAAIRRGAAEARPAVLIGGIALAALWSACSGILLLDLVAALGHSLG